MKLSMPADARFSSTWHKPSSCVAGSLAGPARYFHRNWALPFSVGILFTIEMKSLSYPFGSDSNVFVPSTDFCQSLTTAVGDISSGGSFFLRRRSGDLHGYTRLWRSHLRSWTTFAGPSRGTVSRTARVSIARWNPRKPQAKRWTDEQEAHEANTLVKTVNIVKALSWSAKRRR